jgi:hypothetical protein
MLSEDEEYIPKFERVLQKLLRGEMKPVVQNYQLHV